MITLINNNDGGDDDGDDDDYNNNNNNNNILLIKNIERLISKYYKLSWGPKLRGDQS